MVVRAVLAIGVILVTAPVSLAQAPRPTTWRWVTDGPAEHQTAPSPPEGTWVFAVMAPGWHITTRPGVVLFEPDYAGTGRFSLEAETFLFPGDSQSGLGLMVGGRDLERDAAQYTAFLIRRDGSVAIERRAGGRTTALVGWTRVPDVQPGRLAEPVRNVLRVDVESDVTRFLVNGALVGEVRRPAIESSGIVGLRIGENVDVHVTNLDLTLKLALPRPTP